MKLTLSLHMKKKQIAYEVTFFNKLFVRSDFSTVRATLSLNLDATRKKGIVKNKRQEMVNENLKHDDPMHIEDVKRKNVKHLKQLE